MGVQLRNFNLRTPFQGGEKMSYSKLRGRIVEYFGTNAAFADAMDIDRSSLSFKLNNKTPWKREEIERACILLEVPIEEVHLYFFS
jgi:hypothetical protein